ncbi:hypothetical protein [Psychrobacter sp. UBA3962]|uniref:hypothetical protein n=1 Tax=Psychrobacter sp. UBA3962 TaxID=1947352 RepID=UPI0025F190DC|nr:hypothetical protein [Psychrobacter sp. UBA3962]
MADYHGFQVLSERGDVQLSDKAYDITWQNATELKGEGEFSGDFIAVEPRDGETFYPFPLKLRIGGWSDDTVFADINPDKIQMYKGSGRVHFFGYTTTPPVGENFGLQVFNENKELTFSSGMLSLDILEVVEVDDVRINTNSVISRHFVGDRKVAIVPLGNPFLMVREGDKYDHFDVWSASFSREGQYIVTKYIKSRESYIPSFIGFRYTSRSSLQFLIIDLKGF